MLHIRNWWSISVLFILTCLLAACSVTQKPVEVAPIPTGSEVQPTEVVEKTEQIFPTATPTQEPVALTYTPPESNELPVAGENGYPLAVYPADFSQRPTDVEMTLDREVNDLVEATAVYAWYVTENGPSLFVDESEFIEAMQVYLDDQAQVEVVTTDKGDFKYAMLVKGGQVFLQYTLDGALRFDVTGLNSPDSIGEWVDLGLADGEKAELWMGKDNKSYIVVVDSNGKALRYLNTKDANKDNLQAQMIEVVNGVARSIWNAETGQWETNPDIFKVDLSRLPESTTDTTGVVNFETMKQDLTALRKAILADAQNRGITATELPVIGQSGDFDNYSVSDWAFFPTKFNQEIVIVNPKGETPFNQHITLTELRRDGEFSGYVINALCRPSDRSGLEEMLVTQIVVDKSVLELAEQERAAAGSIIEYLATWQSRLEQALLTLAGSPQAMLRFIVAGDMKPGMEAFFPGYDDWIMTVREDGEDSSNNYLQLIDAIRAGGVFLMWRIDTVVK